MIRNSNRPVVLEIVCSICQSRGYLRTKPEHAIDVALSGGWMIFNRRDNVSLCMAHNPARTEFWAYEKQVAAGEVRDERQG